MMVRSAVCAAAAAFMGLSSPAMAQGSPAQQAGLDILDVDIKESDFFEMRTRDPQVAAGSYSSALSFANCVAQRDPAAMRSVLATNAGSPEEAKVLRDLSKRHGSCRAPRGAVPILVIRGALAETMWKQAGANPNPAKRTSVAIEDVENFIKAAPLGETKTKAAGLPVSWVARCQVMALPAESAKVLAVQPGSKEEQAAAAQLYAESQVCGVKKGLEKTSPTLVRAALADALYQDGARVTARAP